LDDQILNLAERPMLRLVGMIGVYLAASELPLPPAWETVLTGVLLMIVVLVAVKVATKISLVLLIAYGTRVSDDLGKERYEQDYAPLLSKIVGTILFVFGLVIVLHHFGQDVSSLVAALGIGGLAISFAAKDTLGNMFAGFTILLDRPFRPGDRIKLATGETGDVVEVGARSTRGRLLHQNLLIVPDRQLGNHRGLKFNFPTHEAGAQVDVGVAYGADIDRAKAIVREAIQAQPEVSRKPYVLLTSFGDSALNLTGTFVVAQWVDVGAVQDRIRTRIYIELEKAGISIPYPTRELIVTARCR